MINFDDAPRRSRGQNLPPRPDDAPDATEEQARNLWKLLVEGSLKGHRLRVGNTLRRGGQRGSAGSNAEFEFVEGQVPVSTGSGRRRSSFDPRRYNLKIVADAMRGEKARAIALDNLRFVMDETTGKLYLPWATKEGEARSHNAIPRDLRRYAKDALYTTSGGNTGVRHFYPPGYGPLDDEDAPESRQPKAPVSELRGERGKKRLQDWWDAGGGTPGVTARLKDFAEGGETGQKFGDESVYAAVAKRFGIPIEVVQKLLTTPTRDLAERDQYFPPSSSRNETVGPTLDYEKFPLGTPKIGHSQHATGNTPEAYVDYLREFDPHSLSLAEAEDGMTNAPSTQKYVEWMKAGHQPPPINVFDTGGGRLQTSNRRRTLAARLAGKRITGWYGPMNAESGNPLKHGDIDRAADEVRWQQFSHPQQAFGIRSIPPTASAYLDRLRQWRTPGSDVEPPDMPAYELLDKGNMPDGSAIPNFIRRDVLAGYSNHNPQSTHAPNRLRRVPHGGLDYDPSEMSDRVPTDAEKREIVGPNVWDERMVRGVVNGKPLAATGSLLQDYELERYEPPAPKQSKRRPNPFLAGLNLGVPHGMLERHNLRYPNYPAQQEARVNVPGSATDLRTRLLEMELNDPSVPHDALARSREAWRNSPNPGVGRASYLRHNDEYANAYGSVEGSSSIGNALMQKIGDVYGTSHEIDPAEILKVLSEKHGSPRGSISSALESAIRRNISRHRFARQPQQFGRSMGYAVDVPEQAFDRDETPEQLPMLGGEGRYDELRGIAAGPKRRMDSRALAELLNLSHTVYHPGEPLRRGMRNRRISTPITVHDRSMTMMPSLPALNLTPLDERMPARGMPSAPRYEDRQGVSLPLRGLTGRERNLANALGADDFDRMRLRSMPPLPGGRVTRPHDLGADLREMGFHVPRRRPQGHPDEPFVVRQSAQDWIDAHDEPNTENLSTFSRHQEFARKRELFPPMMEAVKDPIAPNASQRATDWYLDNPKGPRGISEPDQAPREPKAGARTRNILFNPSEAFPRLGGNANRATAPANAPSAFEPAADSQLTNNARVLANHYSKPDDPVVNVSERGAQGIQGLLGNIYAKRATEGVRKNYESQTPQPVGRANYRNQKSKGGADDEIGDDPTFNLIRERMGNNPGVNPRVSKGWDDPFDVPQRQIGRLNNALAEWRVGHANEWLGNAQRSPIGINRRQLTPLEIAGYTPAGYSQPWEMDYSPAGDVVNDHLQRRSPLDYAPQPLDYAPQTGFPKAPGKMWNDVVNEASPIPSRRAAPQPKSWNGGLGGALRGAWRGGTSGLGTSLGNIGLGLAGTLLGLGTQNLGTIGHGLLGIGSGALGIAGTPLRAVGGAGLGAAGYDPASWSTKRWGYKPWQVQQRQPEDDQEAPWANAPERKFSRHDHEFAAPGGAPNRVMFPSDDGSAQPGQYANAGLQTQQMRSVFGPQSSLQTTRPPFTQAAQAGGTILVTPTGGIMGVVVPPRTIPVSPTTMQPIRPQPSTRWEKPRQFARHDHEFSASGVAGQFAPNVPAMPRMNRQTFNPQPPQQEPIVDWLQALRGTGAPRPMPQQQIQRPRPKPRPSAAEEFWPRVMPFARRPQQGFSILRPYETSGGGKFPGRGIGSPYPRIVNGNVEYDPTIRPIEAGNIERNGDELRITRPQNEKRISVPVGAQIRNGITYFDPSDRIEGTPTDIQIEGAPWRPETARIYDDGGDGGEIEQLDPRRDRETDDSALRELYEWRRKARLRANQQPKSLWAGEQLPQSLDGDRVETYRKRENELSMGPEDSATGEMLRSLAKLENRKFIVNNDGFTIPHPEGDADTHPLGKAGIIQRPRHWKLGRSRLDQSPLSQEQLKVLHGFNPMYLSADVAVGDPEWRRLANIASSTYRPRTKGALDDRHYVQYGRMPSAEQDFSILRPDETGKGRGLGSVYPRVSTGRYGETNVEYNPNETWRKLGEGIGYRDGEELEPWSDRRMEDRARVRDSSLMFPTDPLNDPRDFIGEFNSNHVNRVETQKQLSRHLRAMAAEREMGGNMVMPGLYSGMDPLSIAGIRRPGRGPGRGGGPRFMAQHSFSIGASAPSATTLNHFHPSIRRSTKRRMFEVC